MILPAERARRLQIRQLGPELTCQLCHGYFVDAFTVVECLHSFCKSCIMRHVQSSSDCPTCGAELNKARITAAIRPDQTLQSVVYKLVPRLFNDEMQRRRHFYRKLDHARRDRSLSPERRGDVSSQQFVYTLTDPISFSLEFCRSGADGGEDANLPAVRYFQAPAGLGISQLKKLLHLKHGLEPREAKVDILHEGHVLSDDLTVMDVACQHNGEPTVPMAFFYRWTRKRAAAAAASEPRTASRTDTAAAAPEPPPKRWKNSASAPEAGSEAALACRTDEAEASAEACRTEEAAACRAEKAAAKEAEAAVEAADAKVEEAMKEARRKEEAKADGKEAEEKAVAPVEMAATVEAEVVRRGETAEAVVCREEVIVAREGEKELQAMVVPRLGGAPLEEAAPSQSAASVTPDSAASVTPAVGEALAAPLSTARTVVGPLTADPADAKSAVTPREASGRGEGRGESRGEPSGASRPSSGAGTERPDSGERDSYSSALLTNGVASGAGAPKTSAPRHGGGCGGSKGQTDRDAATADASPATDASPAASAETGGTAAAVEHSCTARVNGNHVSEKVPDISTDDRIKSSDVPTSVISTNTTTQVTDSSQGTNHVMKTPNSCAVVPNPAEIWEVQGVKTNALRGSLRTYAKCYRKRKRQKNNPELTDQRTKHVERTPDLCAVVPDRTEFWKEDGAKTNALRGSLRTYTKRDRKRKRQKNDPELADGETKSGFDLLLAYDAGSNKKTSQNKDMERVSNPHSSPADVKSAKNVSTSSLSNGVVSSGKALNPNTKTCSLEPGEISKSPDHPANRPTAQTEVLPKSTNGSTNGVSSVITPLTSATSSVSSIVSLQRSVASLTTQQELLTSKGVSTPRSQENGKESPLSMRSCNAQTRKEEEKGRRPSIDVYDFDDEAEEKAAVRLKAPTPTEEVNGGHAHPTKHQQTREGVAIKNGHAGKRDKHVGAHPKESSLSSNSVPPITKTTEPAHSAGNLVQPPSPIIPGISSPYLHGFPSVPFVSFPHQHYTSPGASGFFFPQHLIAPGAVTGLPQGVTPPLSAPGVMPSPRRSLASLPDLRPIGAGAIPLMTGQLDQFLRLVSQSAVSHPNGSWRLPADASALLTRAAAPPTGKPILPKLAPKAKLDAHAGTSALGSEDQRTQPLQVKVPSPATLSVQVNSALTPGTSEQRKSKKLKTGKNGKNSPQSMTNKQLGGFVKTNGKFPSHGMLSEEVSITRIPRSQASSVSGASSGPGSERSVLSPRPAEPPRRLSPDNSVTIERISAPQPPLPLPPPPQSQHQPKSQQARPPNSPKLLAIAASLAMRKIQSQQQESGGTVAGKASPPSPSAVQQPSALNSLISMTQAHQQQQQQHASELVAAARGRPAASGGSARCQIPNPALLHQQSQGRLTVLGVPPAEAAGASGTTTTTGTTSASLARMERLTNSLGR